MRISVSRIRFWGPVIIAFFVLFSLSSHWCLAKDGVLQGRKKILVLHTFNAARPWVLSFNRHLSEELKKSGILSYDLDFEHLDLIRFNDIDYLNNINEQLEHKYTGAAAPDILIMTLTPAVHFVLEFYLFPDIPKIVVVPDTSQFVKIYNSTVIPIAYDFKGNVEHALSLLPDTETIYVVAGNSQVDHQMEVLFRNQTKGLAKEVSFQYLTGLDVDDVLSRVGNLPPRSFVYSLAYTSDTKGRPVVNQDFCKWLGEKSNRPVFTFLDQLALDTGVLGGRVTSTRALTSIATGIIKRVFQGEAIDSITTSTPAFEYIYEWGELIRWNINRQKLPRESVFLNRTYTYLELFELFKWQIFTGIFLLIVESLLIVFLSVNIKKRKIAELELHAYQAELEKKVELRTAELKIRNRDLQKALDEIKTLRGIIPICSSCKQIRDDRGIWKKIEEYLHEHSNAEFSHAVCPKCMKKYYYELDELKKELSEKKK